MTPPMLSVQDDVPLHREPSVISERPYRQVNRSRKPPKVVPRGKPPPGGLEALGAKIAACESGGSPTAYNRSSGASGLFQFLRSTWAGHGGYAEARHAPPEIQWEKFRILYAASGLRPWASSRGCWA